MKYVIELESTTIAGRFSAEGEMITPTIIKVLEDLEINGVDISEVVIQNTETQDSIGEIWVVMWGTRTEIINLIEDALPMAKMESDAIFNVLDNVGEADRVLLSYTLKSSGSSIIRNSTISTALRQYKGAIISEAFCIHTPETMEYIEVDIASN